MNLHDLTPEERRREAEEELAWAGQYDALAEKVSDPQAQAEFRAMALKAREQAARIFAYDAPRLSTYGELEPGRGTG